MCKKNKVFTAVLFLIQEYSTNAFRIVNVLESVFVNGVYRFPILFLLGCQCVSVSVS